MRKFIRVCWGWWVMIFGSCPYCLSDDTVRQRCPVCFGASLKDHHAHGMRKRLWSRFRAHIDKDYS